jgi:hypothetical protein
VKVKEFLENFCYVAEAPNGVVRLRELIYHLSITGAVCPQLEQEGTGASLLEFVLAEREKRRSAGSFKLSAKLEKARGDFHQNLPEIPSSWAWARLVNIGEISPKNDAEDKTAASFVPMGAISLSASQAVRVIGDVEQGTTVLAVAEGVDLALFSGRSVGVGRRAAIGTKHTPVAPAPRLVSARSHRKTETGI